MEEEKKEPKDKLTRSQTKLGSPWGGYFRGGMIPRLAKNPYFTFSALQANGDGLLQAKQKVSAAIIIDALENYHYNRGEAATALGMTRTGLYRLLHSLTALGYVNWVPMQFKDVTEENENSQEAA